MKVKVLQKAVVKPANFAHLLPQLGKLVRLAKVRCEPVDIAWHPCYHACVIQSFFDQGTEDVFNGVNSKNARKTCPKNLWRIAGRKECQSDG